MFVFRSSSHERGFRAGGQEVLGIEIAEDLHQCSNRASPAGLVAGSQPRSIVAVEVLVKKQVVLPLRIGLKFCCAAENRPATGLVSQKNPDQAAGNFPGYFEQFQEVSRAGRALDFEIVTV